MHLQRFRTHSQKCIISMRFLVLSWAKAPFFPFRFTTYIRGPCPCLQKRFKHFLSGLGSEFITNFPFFSVRNITFGSISPRRTHRWLAMSLATSLFFLKLPSAQMILTPFGLSCFAGWGEGISLTWRDEISELLRRQKQPFTQHAHNCWQLIN